MKTLTEYMESTFSGEYHPFTETPVKTYIQLRNGSADQPKPGTRANRSAKRIVKQMRADGWAASLSGDIVTVRQ